ncbi:major facilitator superfamily MFS_1 [Serinicoccus hydrothermalis]|uniref:Major facilitator superfamily MFS_1 n=1 Tax=Serinicoccus hydrothermalis TaxID=1758689 RepID=A0A1B1NB91_9MICO|nr:major facilitator superfamily MFS_1 [Serinicoccus hydrothermalis]
MASTLGWVALSTTTLGIDVLVISSLGADEVEVGVVRAAQFLPYLLVGLLAGALVDRWRRRPTLVVTHLGRGLVLLLLAALWWVDALTVGGVVALLLVGGTFAVFAAAAEQSILPDLVPRSSLVDANARLGQSATVAQTAGPPVGGALVAAAGVSSALVLGAVARVVAALLLSRLPVHEAPVAPAARRAIGGEIVSGLRFIYGHRTLAPLAVSTHVWFLANSLALTVLGLFVLRDLDLSAAGYGLVLAAAGVGGFVGALLAPAVGRLRGEGDVMIASRLLCALAWAAVALTPDVGPAATVAVLCATQLLYGFALGVEDPNEMGYWQARTPRALLGRVNASRRSANRSVAVVGALAGGVLASVLDLRVALGVVALVFLAATLVLALSPVRGARVGDPDPGL